MKLNAIIRKTRIVYDTGLASLITTYQPGIKIWIPNCFLHKRREGIIVSIPKDMKPICVHSGMNNNDTKERISAKHAIELLDIPKL